jgi:hypothetical protein
LTKAGVAVMVIPWKKCPTLLFVDGLRCMAIETNDHRLRSLQLNLLFPGHFFPGDVISCYTGNLDSYLHLREIVANNVAARIVTDQPHSRYFSIFSPGMRLTAILVADVVLAYFTMMEIGVN